jgi:hypothetical protein
MPGTRTSPASFFCKDSGTVAVTGKRTFMLLFRSETTVDNNSGSGDKR